MAASLLMKLPGFYRRSFAVSIPPVTPLSPPGNLPLRGPAHRFAGSLAALVTSPPPLPFSPSPFTSVTSALARSHMQSRQSPLPLSHSAFHLVQCPLQLGLCCHHICTWTDTFILWLYHQGELTPLLPLPRI